MPNYLTPGVYIEEVATGPRPIEAVGTSTAGFVGVAPNATAQVNNPMPISNWAEFQRTFIPQRDAKSTPLSNGVFGFFQNGGAKCYIVNVGEGGSLIGDAAGPKGLDKLAEYDEVAIVAAPGYCDAASYDAVLTHCERLKDRVAILDAPREVPKLEQLTRTATVSSSRRPRRGGEVEEPSAESEGSGPGLRPRPSDGGFGAYYFPHLVVRDPLQPSETIIVPPSGHVAGIYARTDATRGVHKAPANEIVRGALGLTHRVTDETQGELNSNGVNCIRSFSREGIRVWGARTVAASASEWRYLNVRRLFNMIEESIARSTRWVVFEPNDLPLWKAIRRDVRAFLMLLWRQGALMGATPDEAFFVKCDAETNPREVVDAGRVETLIGIAPVKPAEFVVFRIGQGVGGTEIEITG